MYPYYLDTLFYLLTSRRNAMCFINSKYVKELLIYFKDQNYLYLLFETYTVRLYKISSVFFLSQQLISF